MLTNNSEMAAVHESGHEAVAHHLSCHVRGVEVHSDAALQRWCGSLSCSAAGCRIARENRTVAEPHSPSTSEFRLDFSADWPRLRCRPNTLAGVTIKQGGKPTVRRCRIQRNGIEAVWVSGEGKGTIVDCHLTANTHGPGDIHPGCQVTRRRNRT
jgi:hypothetical protein